LALQANPISVKPFSCRLDFSLLFISLPPWVAKYCLVAIHYIAIFCIVNCFYITILLQRMVEMSVFSERLKSIRVSKNISQPNVAKSCEIALRSYVYYEAGVVKPSSDVIIARFEFFQVSADFQHGLSDEPQTS